MADIRPFRENDAEPVVALSLRAWEPVHESIREVLGDEPFERRNRPDWRTRQGRDVRAVLAGEDNTVWVAEDEGRVVGFVAATIHHDDDAGEIQMLAVDPPSQNRGIGTELTEVATAWIRGSGVSVAFISTGGDVGHAAARATYDKAGYRRLPVTYFLKAL